MNVLPFVFSTIPTMTPLPRAAPPRFAAPSSLQRTNKLLCLGASAMLIRTTLFLLTTLGTLGIAASVQAQPTKVVQPVVELTTTEAAKTEAAKASGAKAKQRITQLKKLKMIELLDMDEQTAEKFLMRYNTEQKKVDDALKALNTTMADMDKALQDPKKTPESLKQLNDQTLDKQVQMQSAVTERLRSLRPILNERQYAKFLLFEAKFQEQVRKTLLDVKREANQENNAQKK